MTGARRPRKRVLLAACVAALAAAVCAFALAAALAAPRTAEAASVCAQKTPTQLKFQRRPGKRHGRLSWHASRGAHGRFRVFRNGAVVGQTLNRSMRVSVEPGRQYIFSVRPVSSAGSVSNCAGELSQTLRWYPPFKVLHIAVRRIPGKLRATLSWGKVRPGDGRLAGYRVFRDGKVYRQVKPRRRSIPVRVTPGIHVFRVIAADTRGAIGLPSRIVRVRVRHSAPSVPGRLRIGTVSDTSVELGWGLARKRSSPIAGYRILRNGVPVGQVASLSANITNLAPATGYRFAVAAVDRWGYAGPSTVAQATTAMPPPTVGNLHAFLLATTDESFLDLQRHYRADRDCLPDVLRLPSLGRGDHRQRGPVGHALGTAAEDPGDAALQLPTLPDPEDDPARPRRQRGDSHQSHEHRAAAWVRRHQPRLRGRF